MKILIYPKDANPYQELLYTNFPKNIILTYLIGPTKSHTLNLFILPLQIIIYKMQGYNIFHLHWVYMFRFTVKGSFFRNPLFTMIFTLYFLAIIGLIKLLRYKLVWTTHDLTPHGNQFTDDILISRVLSKLSNAKILHAKSTLKIMSKINLNTDNCKVIPIGNYIDAYPNFISASESRAILNIDKKDFVFGFFGRLEGYKGIFELVDTYSKLNLPNTKLLIVGPYLNEEIKKYIERKADINKNIIIYPTFIPEDKVQIYINSIDIFVYPFKKVTTSSSVILAMSFKKPVIASLVGDIQDLPEYTGYYYNPNLNLDGLEINMRKAVTDKDLLAKKGHKAFNYIKEYTWKYSAKQTLKLYEDLS